MQALPDISRSQLKSLALKRRWGSSGSKGTVNFSWRLIMAPLEIIDYVIVHELVHLEQRDHSRLFWDKVKSIMPDFKKRQKVVEG